MITRRSLLGKAGGLALGVGVGWLLRDYVFWPAPSVAFSGEAVSSGWRPFAVPGRRLITLDVELNGQPTRALLDSGAQCSVLDAAYAAAQGVPLTFAAPMIAYGVAGAPQIGRGVSLDLQVGPLRLGDLRAAVLDIGPMTLAVGAPIPLILGQDVLSTLIADVDFPRSRLAFHRPEGHVLPAGARPAPARRQGKALITEVSVEGVPLEVVLDTGASSSLSLASDVAEAAGLLAGRPVGSATTMVLGGVAHGRTVRAQSISFAGDTFEDAEVHIYPQRPLPGFPRGLLGVGTLSRFRAVLDHGGGALHLIRAPVRG